MKNKIIFGLSIFIMFLSTAVLAQESNKTIISSIRLKDKTVELTVASIKPFIIGGNIYQLYIGNKKFQLSKQTKIDGLGFVTFLIPYDEFKLLKDGSAVWMIYGDLIEENQGTIDFVNFYKENPNTCWSLGKLRKKSLKK